MYRVVPLHLARSCHARSSDPFREMGSYSITASGISNASFVLLALFTIPSLWRLTKRTRRVKATNEPALYEDEDGAATEESQALYSTKYQFASIFVLLGLGLATSLGLAIVATVRKDQFQSSDLMLVQLWLLFPSWVSAPPLEVKSLHTG